MDLENIIVRALALADTGRFDSSTALRAALKREGYTVEDFRHFQSPSLTRELNRRRKAAWTSRHAP